MYNGNWIFIFLNIRSDHWLCETGKINPIYPIGQLPHDSRPPPAGVPAAILAISHQIPPSAANITTVFVEIIGECNCK